MKLLVPLLLAVAIPVCAQKASETWMEYGGGPNNSKYVDFTQITKANVKQLQVAWTYSTRDDNTYIFNPLIVDDVMYVLARANSLVALDAATGKEIWVHENLRGIAQRGINYWESKDRKDRRLIFQMNNFLQEIDARTGKSILSFGNNGLVSLKEGLGRDPKTLARVQSGTPGKIFENLIILGSAPGEGYLAAPGDIRAFDVLTGKMAWTFHTIPHPGEFGYDTWPKDAWKYSGAANTWGELTLDDQHGIVFAPTGSATYDYYGADRIGSNLFANCLLALDARTGKRLWHFQMVHHDLWDYDATAAPQLATIQHDGKLIEAVAQASKQGFLYVFNRLTGEPVWPIEERPVPASDMPGEKAWATQPFPTAPPPFARQIMTANDVNPYLPAAERAQWKDRVASARNGLFTPPSTKESIALPGARGGANWGTTAANPEKGMVYVLAQDWPSFYKLGLQVPGQNRNAASQDGRAVYEQNCQSCHGADRRGQGAFPSLVNIADRVTQQDLRQIVLTGKNEMPAFANLDASIASLYAFLGGGPGNGRGTAPAASLGGPVVASGGAPGGQEITVSQYFGMAGPPYPDGIDVPKERYYTDYGLGQPWVLSPPWSFMVAYDLNKGEIKWRHPIGDDPETVAAGGKNTGQPRGAERHGMIVTTNGLIFANTRDQRICAYDESTGDLLWEAKLPAPTEGIPAMYAVKGRQYLVVPAAATPASDGRKRDTAPILPGSKAYVAFALPETTKAAIH